MMQIPKKIALCLFMRHSWIWIGQRHQLSQVVYLLHCHSFRPPDENPLHSTPRVSGERKQTSLLNISLPPPKHKYSPRALYLGPTPPALLHLPLWMHRDLRVR